MDMSRFYLTHSVDQPYLLPISPADWLAPNHLCFSVLDVVDNLDVSEFHAAYSKDGRGAPAFSPKMMVAVILYSWCRSVYSSRKIALLCREDLGARVIVGEYQPDFRTINVFRSRHGQALAKLFESSVRLCQEAGLVSLVDTAGDGTKIAANASKDRSMTSAEIQALIKKLMDRSAAEDAQEDSLFGPDNPEPSAVPDELADRKTRLARLKEAQEALKARAIEQQTKLKERFDNQPPDQRPHRKPMEDPKQAEPKPEQQYNFTDPDSRLMKQNDSSFAQAYNAQILVDGDHQIIVGSTLSNEVNDFRQLCPLVDHCLAVTGKSPTNVLADKGYHSQYNLEQMQKRGITPFIPPQRRNKNRQLTPEQHTAYKRRSTIVEPVFGQIKGNGLGPGFRRFFRRGLQKCRQDWSLLCCAHNLKKLFANQKPPQPQTNNHQAAGMGQKAEDFALSKLFWQPLLYIWAKLTRRTNYLTSHSEKIAAFS